jgi:hypothetical protein
MHACTYRWPQGAAYPLPSEQLPPDVEALESHLGKAARRVGPSSASRPQGARPASKPKLNHEPPVDAATSPAAACVSADKASYEASASSSGGGYVKLLQDVLADKGLTRTPLRLERTAVLGGRPALPVNVGKATFNMLAVQYGGSNIVLLPGSFQDPHVLQVSVRVCVCVFVCVCACARACARACVRACVYTRVCIHPSWKDRHVLQFSVHIHAHLFF